MRKQHVVSLGESWKFMVYGRGPYPRRILVLPEPNKSDPADWRSTPTIRRKYWHRNTPARMVAVPANMRRREDKEKGVAPSEYGGLHLFARKRFNI